MPPDGKLDASGSPRTSSLPENSSDRFAVAGRREKRVVLLGGDAGQRLEPVRVVRRAVLDRPLLHRGRDRVGDRDVERLAVRHRAAQRVINRLGETRLLDFVVEHEAAERFGRRARARGSFASVTDQLRIEPIASPSTLDPIAAPPCQTESDSVSKTAHYPKTCAEVAIRMRRQLCDNRARFHAELSC